MLSCSIACGRHAFDPVGESATHGIARTAGRLAVLLENLKIGTRLGAGFVVVTLALLVSVASSGCLGIQSPDQPIETALLRTDLTFARKLPKQLM